MNPSCPQCGSTDTAPIVYGEPDSETTKAWERGEVELGGCLVTGNDPTHECRACTKEFGASDEL